MGLGGCAQTPKQNPIEENEQTFNEDADIQKILQLGESEEGGNEKGTITKAVPRIEFLLDSEESNQVAVLLPLRGELMPAGEAIKEGILQAYYGQNIGYKVQFYDTHGKDINALYQRVLKNDVNMVIGPLQKSNVDALGYSPNVLNIPLNRTGKASNVYPFDITVESEIKQLAEIIKQRGYCRIMFVSLDGKRERLIGEMLKQYVQDNGGQLKEQIYLPVNQINESTKILRKALQTTRILEVSENERFVTFERDDYPFVRQDVDVIISHLPVIESRLYVPLYRSLGGDLPVLSTSEMVAGGHDLVSGDPDLIGIEFLDLPSSNINNEGRLFQNIGFDAIMLSNALRFSENFQFQGRTGSYEYKNGKSIRFLDIYQITSDGLKVNAHDHLVLDES